MLVTRQGENNSNLVSDVLAILINGGVKDREVREGDGRGLKKERHVREADAILLRHLLHDGP
jgi:hypothetical protein